jgi:pilus assembly protein TadC
VAIHPENYGGKQMKVIDILSFGMPLLVGFSLMSRYFKRTSLLRTMFRVPDKVIEVHRKAHSKLIRGKSFPIPGGMLVTSLRGWLAGEIVWISVMAVSLAEDRSLSRVAFSLFFGLGLGFFTLYLSIREQARKKLENVRSALPVASFLLSLLLEAGMGSHSALQEVSQAIPKGPLARELEEISRARMLGISRGEALERSRGRVPLDDYQIFLNLIRQGERLGVGLSRGLRDHSSKMLEKEGYRAEAVAQKAAVKLLFPLVAFIFPAVVLIIFSPIILNILEIWGH